MKRYIKCPDCGVLVEIKDGEIITESNYTSEDLYKTLEEKGIMLGVVPPKEVKSNDKG